MCVLKGECMKVFAKPINKAFVLDPDKAEEFINHRNPESLKKIETMADEFLKIIENNKKSQIEK